MDSRPEIQAPRQLPRDLALDLDGTLVATDTLIESVVSIVTRRPHRIWPLLSSLFRGRANFKRAAAELATVEYASLPYRIELITYAKSRREEGASIHLITAADQSIADGVAKHLGIFDSAYGSNGEHNLKGAAKAAWLKEKFPAGFGYAGDCAADRPVWAEASERLVIGKSREHANKLTGASGEPHRVFVSRGASLKEWVKALRLHQWVKNILIFIPLLLTRHLTNIDQIAAVSLGFLLFGLTASGTYLLNDINDLAADRAHPAKRRRALASGKIPILWGVLLALGLIAAGVAGSILLKPNFGLVVLAYLIVTMTYSLKLKSRALTDVLTIGVLFMIRLIAGMVLLGQSISLWLCSFALMLFTSLALAKRNAELVQTLRLTGNPPKGRGYHASDTPLTLAVGTSTAVVATLIMLLYFQLDAVKTGLYTHVDWLYLIPLVFMSWTFRIWIRAHRGTLQEDPVIFALKDPVSWGQAAVIFALWWVSGIK